MTQELRKFVSESAVYGLVSAAPAVSSLVLVPVYTRRFEPAEYGVVGLLAAVLTLLSILIVLSLDSAAQRWYHLAPERNKRRATFASWIWCQLTMAVILCVFGLAFAHPVAGWAFGDSKYDELVRTGVLTLPLATLPTILTNWLRFQRRAWAAAAVALTVAVVTLTAILCYLNVAGLGLRSVPLGQVTGSGVGAVLAIAMLRGWLDPRKIDIALLGSMLRYAIPLVPATVSIWIVNLFDRYIVEAFAGSAQVGFYQAATQMAAVVGIAVTAFQLAWGPFAFARAAHAGARESYAHVMLGFVTVTSVACAALGAFAPEIMRMVATPRYLAGAQSVPWLAFSFVGVGLLSVAAIGPSLVGRTGIIATATLIGAGLTVALDFTLIPKWGSLGAAIATCLSWLAVPVYLFYRGEKTYRVGYPFLPAAFVVCWGLATAVGAERLSTGSTAATCAFKCLLWFADLLVGWLVLRRAAKRTRANTSSHSDDVIAEQSFVRFSAVGSGVVEA